MIRRCLLTATSALLLLTTACGSSNAPAETSGGSSAPAAAAATSAPAATVAPTAAPTAESVAFSAEDIGKASDRLTELDSYQMNFTMSFEGKDNGETRTGSMTMVQQYIKEGGQQRITMTTDGSFPGADENGGGDIEMVMTADSNYMVMSSDGSEPQCIQSPRTGDQEPPSAPFSPSELTEDNANITLVKRGEIINGIETDHYKIEEQVDTNKQGVASGDMWVATDGGYMVKYTGTYTGNDLFSTEDTTDSEGKATWEYTIDKINAVDDLSIPEACSAAAQANADIPTPEDASDLTVLGKMRTFASTQSVADLTSFYREQMPANGWAEGEAGLESEGMTTLNFTKEARKISVTILKNESKTSVMLSEE